MKVTRRKLLGCILTGLAALSGGCAPTERKGDTGPANTGGTPEPGNTIEEGAPGTVITSSIVFATLNGTEIIIELEDNDAAIAFRELLPFSAILSELNGNEKYVYLESDLPVSASNPNIIKKGDVMLFGDDCLVVFYETFPTSYRYTRIGRVTEPDSLDGIAAAQTVEAMFAMVE